MKFMLITRVPHVVGEPSLTLRELPDQVLGTEEEVVIPTRTGCAFAIRGSGPCIAAHMLVDNQVFTILPAHGKKICRGY